MARPERLPTEGNFNYRSSCTRGIFSLLRRNAILSRTHCSGEQDGRDLMDRESRESMKEIHLRILRVTEDLRMIQRELNCAAMQAPTDPELMEALADPPEMEAVQMLKSSLDQMRHFLWFYMQVVNSDSEIGEKLRQTFRQDAPVKVPEMEQQFQSATDAIMLRYLADNKYRKPN